MSPPPKLSRRTLTFGGIAAVGAAVVAGAAYEIPKLFKRRASGKYAALVNRLDNPEAASLVGQAVDRPSSDGASFEDEAFHDLKGRLAKQPLSALMTDDAKDLGRMVEANGWVIPLSLAEICVLAAQSV